MTLKTKLLTSWRTRPIFRSRKSFGEDESGIAAMEFAIIAPMIIGVYLGLAELALVLGIERQISHSASVAGDLATQVSTLEEDDVEDLISAVLRVANVRDTASYTMHLESFERDSSGTTKSLGEVSYNSNRNNWLADFDADSLKTDMLSEDSGIVVARVAFRYSPMGFKNTMEGREGQKYLPGTLTLRETFLLKPRRSANVQVGDDVGTKIKCTGSASGVNCNSTKKGGGDDDDD